MEIPKHNPLQNIIQRIDGEDTANFLSNEIQGSDFHSMMLHVYDKRSDRLMPTDIYKQYSENRFVKPATVDQRDIVRFDKLFLDTAPQDYVAIELSPTQPFAVNNVLANTDQKLVISSVRNTEVSADITTALALESAVKRQALLDKDHLDRTMIKLCSCHRCVRAQQFDDEQGFTSHFRVMGMLSSYRRGQNSFGYEMEQFSEHIDTYLNLIHLSQEIGCRFQSISVNLSDIRLMEYLITTFGLDRDFLRKNTQNQAINPFRMYDINLPSIVSNLDDLDQNMVSQYGLNDLFSVLKRTQANIFQPMSTKFPDVNFVYDLERIAGIGYYNSICFKISAVNTEGIEFPLADGGTTDWNKKLLNNQKEWLLTSGFGSELYLKQFRV